MASNKAPYYTAAVQSITTGDINGSSNTRYPDLESSMLASSTQMYSLADGALHTHQSSTQIQLEGLLQAATVAAGGEESHYAADGCVMSARFEPKSQLHCQNHAIFDPDQESRSGRTACCTSSNRSHGSGSSLDSPNCPSSYASSSPAPRKRRRINGSAPQQPKRSADGPEQVHNSREASSLAAVSSPLQNACTDAKTAGINSAAALFRSPSSSSKKYTRPPMSKLYASLELSPESFLRLQASAKSYMLNSAYPDRGECVGQRGKGDSELVRLKLWNCVNDFLDQEGQGKSFFGVEASGEDGKARSMIWPQDKNRIIGAVTPLLRRMVTNERQRQYAVETRREGGTGDVKQTGDRPKSLSRRPKDHEDSISKHSESQELSRRLYADIIGGNYENDGFRKDLVARNLASRLDNLKCISGLPEVEFYRIIASVNRRLRALNTRVLHEKTPSEHEEITAQMIESGQAWGHGFSGNGGDSDKSHFARLVMLEIIETIKEANADADSDGLSSEPVNSSFNPQPMFPMESLEKTSIRVRSQDESDPVLLSCHTMKLRFTVLAADQRNVVDFKSTVSDCPDYRGLCSKILQHYHPPVDDSFSIRVLLPDGLTPIQTDHEWRIALLLLKDAAWMKDKMTVVVQN